jgi:hypothetical protein
MIDPIGPYGRNEAALITRMMDAGDAGLLTGRINLRLETIPGFEDLPFNMRIAIGMGLH